jgi:hypothetical protein
MEQLTEPLRLRLTPAQMRELKARAQRAGVSLSAFSRKMLAGGRASVTFDLTDPAHARILGELVASAVAKALEERHHGL